MKYLKFRSSQIIFYSISIFLILIIVILLAYLLPPAIDWHTTFRPAALELISGHSPYNVESYFNPPWALIPLIPIALLPEYLGRGVLVVVTLTAFIYTGHQLGAKPLAIFFLVLSPLAIHGILNGNIDWLVTLGFVLPPPIGLFFVTIKPQIGAAVVVFWLVEAWRTGGWLQVVRIIWPITMVMLISLLIFGLWPLHLNSQVGGYWWNGTLWPASIAIGLVLLGRAFQKRRIEYAMGASPCLSPYILLHSWIGVLFAISRFLPELIAIVIGLWIWVLIRMG